MKLKKSKGPILSPLSYSPCSTIAGSCRAANIAGNQLTNAESKGEIATHKTRKPGTNSCDPVSEVAGSSLQPSPKPNPIKYPIREPAKPIIVALMRKME